MDSPFWFDTINLGKSIIHIEGCQVIIFIKYCIVLSFLTFTTSVDPDKMQLYAAFYLGLHCLEKYSFRCWLISNKIW